MGNANSDHSCISILGEFTLRAFLNGRLDLSQAESIGRLISASSVAAADSALAGIQAYAHTLFKLKMSSVLVLSKISDGRLCEMICNRVDSLHW